MKKLLALIFLTACGSGGGSSSAPVNPDLGISISTNQSVSSYLTNMCTQFVGDSCFFEGGQLVKFNDGSVLLTGRLVKIYTNGGNTDVDHNSPMVLIPSNSASGNIELSSVVARGSGFKSLYLVYTRSPESIKLIYDSNGNFNPLDNTDETISTLTLSTWN